MLSLNWIKRLTKQERRAWVAGFVGYACDAFDFMIYPFLIPTLLIVWNMSHGEAGMIATSALLSSAVGGWLAGILADRYGRVRVLQWTIVFFSVFTFLSGFTHSFEQLLFTRTLQGLGFGGEWSVVTVMMSEMARDARHRAKLVGGVQTGWAVGWAGAALIFWLCFLLVPAEYAWRICFWTGILPALWLIYIRRHLSEPEIFQQNCRARESDPHCGFWQIFSKRHRKTTLMCTLLSVGMMGGNFSISTWLPTYLKTVRDLTIANTSGYMVVLIIGSFVGGITGAVVSDAIGRRNALFIFSVCCLLMTLIYMLLPLNNTALLLLGFPLGMVMQGIFTGIGAYFSELYPGAIRGSGQGFCYNTGRGISAVFPLLIGILAESLSLQTVIGIVAGFCYCLVIICACCLPETSGKALS
ncbi:MAG: MFS transporter [Enterobacteriaceae bacterium]